MEINGEVWRRRLFDRGLSDRAVAQLAEYVRMVEGAGRNVTAWRGAELWQKGIWDSLDILSVIDGYGDGLDLGSGAGFPGMVLAIAAAGRRWLLVEGRARRAELLERMVAELGLENVQVVGMRAEEYWRRAPTLQRDVQVVTARAVGPVRVVLELGLPFLAVGGRMVLPKGPGGVREIEGERAWVERLGGQIGPHYVVDGGMLVTVDKVRESPEEYPRRGTRLGR